MRITRIYFNGFIHPYTKIILPPATSHYVMHVLRLKLGALLILFNGDGNEYTATIIEIHKKEVILSIDQVKEKKADSPLRINLAQAISKAEKMDWTIQKAVELGVNEITPLITEYCTIKLDPEKKLKRLSHWHKIIISACEQSGRTQIPTLSSICQFNHWVQTRKGLIKIYCHPYATTKIENLRITSDIVVLVGPEGGLSEQEVDSANKNQFVGISLGPRILRTETAALAAIAILQNRWGDL